MKKEIAKKWVRALRSKKYRQTTGALKVKNNAGAVSHCCLGVLCELYQKEQKKAGKTLLKVTDAPARESDVVLRAVSSTCRVFSFGDAAATLPLKVQRWAGMYNDAGMFRGDRHVTHRGVTYDGLAEMNDARCGFSTIANVIEERAADI